MFKHSAPKSDDTLLAQFLLSNGFTGTVNHPNEKGIMPLHAALLLSNSGNPQGLALVQELLNQGVFELNPVIASLAMFADTNTIGISQSSSYGNPPVFSGSQK